MPSNINSVIKNKIKKKKLFPTDPNFFQHVTVNTDIIFLPNACICMGTHSKPLLQNRLMDNYETW